eukprot:1159148-Pelagomonas_calceolata.AAC.11
MIVKGSVRHTSDSLEKDRMHLVEHEASSRACMACKLLAMGQRFNNMDMRGEGTGVCLLTLEYETKLASAVTIVCAVCFAVHAWCDRGLMHWLMEARCAQQVQTTRLGCQPGPMGSAVHIPAHIAQLSASKPFQWQVLVVPLGAWNAWTLSCCNWAMTNGLTPESQTLEALRERSVSSARHPSCLRKSCIYTVIMDKSSAGPIFMTAQ